MVVTVKAPELDRTVLLVNSDAVFRRSVGESSPSFLNILWKKLLETVVENEPVTSIDLVNFQDETCL